MLASYPKMFPFENDDKIMSYLKYIRKQPASKKIKVHKSNNVRRK